jgi:hypothetical protein
MSVRAKHNTAYVEFFTRPVDRLVRGNVSEIAVGTTHINRELWYLDLRLAAKKKAANDENAGEEAGNYSEYNRTVYSNGFHG